MEEDQGLIRPTFRPLFMVLGIFALILGVVGAFLPILPTTPFLLLSGFFFSKSSPKLHRWLLGLPTFGPMIHDWEVNKAIRPKVKFYAISLLSLAVGYTVFFTERDLWIKLVMLTVWACVSIFIFTRNSR